MHRVAVFVDAGHYFAHAARLAFGEKVPRRELVCDHAGLVTALVEYSTERATQDSDGVRLLRVYWYDGAPNAVASNRQLEIARLSGVKIRLGRLSGKQQKGVDGLIILDLITLARERAIDTAVLLSGDEDLREAVAAAQQFGVRVVLLGIPPGKGRGNQAESLVREADHHEVLPKEFWCPYLTRAEPHLEGIIGYDEKVYKAAGVGTGPVADGAGLETVVEGPPAPPMTVAASSSVAQEFVEQWLGAADPDDVVKVADAKPKIPGSVDAGLLGLAWERNGRTTLPDSVRRQLRKEFWKAFDAARSPDGEAVASA
jgi:uncharacterized LabA/DUF88 family protein